MLGIAAGCLRSTPPGRAADVIVRRYRYNIDREHNLVHVFGEAANLGEGAVPKIAVKVMVHNTAYAKTGENTLTLERIRPRERRDFAITVTSHGEASSVECQVVELTQAE